MPPFPPGSFPPGHILYLMPAAPSLSGGLRPLFTTMARRGTGVWPCHQPQGSRSMGCVCINVQTYAYRRMSEAYCAAAYAKRFAYTHSHSRLDACQLLPLSVARVGRSVSQRKESTVAHRPSWRRYRDASRLPAGCDPAIPCPLSLARWGRRCSVSVASSAYTGVSSVPASAHAGCASSESPEGVPVRKFEPWPKRLELRGGGRDGPEPRHLSDNFPPPPPPPPTVPLRVEIHTHALSLCPCRARARAWELSDRKPVPGATSI
jgi:hypothetical protein